MTLNTHIYVQGEVNIQELFAFCQELVGSTPDTLIREDKGSIANRGGQGLDAWLEIEYGSPLRAEGTHGEYCRKSPDWDGEEEDDGQCYSACTPCWAKVSFDTAYGFRGPDGSGCTQLHAGYIVKLGLWLQARDVPFSWQNEYTGEVHQTFRGLDDFLGEGEKARDWFTNTVKPAIEQEFPAVRWV